MHPAVRTINRGVPVACGARGVRTMVLRRLWRSYDGHGVRTRLLWRLWRSWRSCAGVEAFLALVRWPWCSHEALWRLWRSYDGHGVSHEAFVAFVAFVALVRNKSASRHRQPIGIEKATIHFQNVLARYLYESQRGPTFL